MRSYCVSLFVPYSFSSRASILAGYNPAEGPIFPGLIHLAARDLALRGHTAGAEDFGVARCRATLVDFLSVSRRLWGDAIH